MKAARLAAIFVCVALFAACGGGLNHADYVKKVNAICDRFNKQQNALKQPASAAEVPSYVDSVLPSFRDEVKQVSDVGPPEADRAKVDQIIADLRLAAAQLEKLKASVTNNDSTAFSAVAQELQRLETSVNQNATSVGLTECANS